MAAKMPLLAPPAKMPQEFEHKLTKEVLTGILVTGEE